MDVNAWDYGPIAETLHVAPATSFTTELPDSFRASRRTKCAAKEELKRSKRDAFRAKLR